MKFLKFLPPNGRHERYYPWEEWTDGQARIAVPGKDFDIDRERFRIILYNYAKRRGLRVTTRAVKEGLAFQFTEGGTHGGRASIRT